jgi:ABC-2 type transport system ATP-binding protein
MSVGSFLAFIAEVRGFRGSERRRRIDNAVTQVQLQGVLRQPIDTLSKGFKRRVGLAQAILHDPRVLILDEPTDGLDPNQKHEVRQLILRMAAAGGGVEESKAIVLSTHILEEVEAVCTRAIVIARGRIVFDGTPQQLQARSRYHNAVTLCLEPPGGATGSSAVLREFAAIKWVHTVEDRGTVILPAGLGGPGGPRLTCTLVAKGGRPILTEVTAFLKAQGWTPDTITVEAGKLDDVFRELTTVAAP